MKMTETTEPTNIISLTKKRRELHGCQHKKIIVCEDLWQVECGDCGEKLDPIWVLSRLATEETNWLRQCKQYKKWKAEYDKRIRVKCINCGKMTPVHVKS